MTRAVFIGTGDLHSNSTLGLCPPTVVLDDEGTYHASKAQLWLWQCWNDLIAEAKGLLRPGDKVYGTVNGDTADVNPKTTQLITFNNSDAVSLAVNTVQPLRDMCVDGFWVQRGTNAHDGPAGSMAEMVAHRLDATKYPRDSERFSCWYLVAKLGGLVFDVTHHGPSGLLPWTRMNAAGRVAFELMELYLSQGKMPPAVALRSHRHKLIDSFDNYPVRVIGLPAWQMATEYAHKVAPRRPCDIGGVICIVEDGHLDVRHVTFKPKAEEVWEPEECQWGNEGGTQTAEITELGQDTVQSVNMSQAQPDQPPQPSPQQLAESTLVNRSSSRLSWRQRFE